MRKNTRKEGKERLNFFITTRNKNTLIKASKFNGNSMGDIINALIEQHLNDPIKLLEAENRELALKINNNQDRIKRLKDKNA